jgi:two-component system, cell cycle response regulator
MLKSNKGEMYMWLPCKDDYRITYLCEFQNTELEREYFEYDTRKSLRYMRPIILILGIMYLLFLIPDYYRNESLVTFVIILSYRLVFFLSTLISYIQLKKIKQLTRSVYYITTFQLSGIITFLLISNRYGIQNYYMQAFGVIIIVLAIFLVPNKWINMILSSAFVSIAFTVMSLRHIDQIGLYSFVAGSIYIVIVIGLTAVSSYRSNYLKRKQYLSKKELRILSEIDQLTGIFNRAKFNKEINYWIDYSRRYSIPLSLAIFDIDNFKMINDTYGHLAGDKVIIGIASTVKNTIRNTDIFARWGGEEFVLLLPNMDNSQGMEFLERLRELIAAHNHEAVGRVTCSFGLVTMAKNDEVDTFINRADQMLYLAKSEGKNKVAG